MELLGVMSALAFFPSANVRLRQMDDIIEEIEAQGRDSRFRAPDHQDVVAITESKNQ